MTSGYYRMHRGWQDHPIFRNDPYSERDAWEWLIAHATYQPITISVGGLPVRLERGQLSYSVRFLAERWRWSKSKVARFIERLQKWDMVLYATCSKSGTGSGTASGTAQGVITICNYERYQFTPDESGTASGTNLGQKRDRSGTNKKEVEGSKSIGGKRGRLVPEDWEPTEKHAALALQLGVDYRRAAEMMRDHEFNRTYSDWDRVFSNWLRRAHDRGECKLNGNGKHATTTTKSVVLDAEGRLREQ